RQRQCAGVADVPGPVWLTRLVRSALRGFLPAVGPRSAGRSAASYQRSGRGWLAGIAAPRSAAFHASGVAEVGWQGLLPPGPQLFLPAMVVLPCREALTGSAHQTKGHDRRGPRHQETKMPKYLLLKHYRGGPEPHRPVPPIDQWDP